MAARRLMYSAVCMVGTGTMSNRGKHPTVSAVEKMANELEEAKASLASALNKSDIWKGRYNESVQERRALATQLGQVTAERDNAMEEDSAVVQELNDMRAERDDLSNKLDQAISDNEILEKEIAKVEAERNQMQYERDALQAAGAPSQNEITRLTTERDQMKAERDNLQAALTNAQDDVAQGLTNLQNAQAQAAGLQAEVNQLRVQRDNLFDDLANAARGVGVREFYAQRRRNVDKLRPYARNLTAAANITWAAGVRRDRASAIAAANFHWVPWTNTTRLNGVKKHQVLALFLEEFGTLVGGAFTGVERALVRQGDNA